MAIARLTGGPLDGQVIPLEEGVDDALIVPYGEGQLVYQRQAADADADGPQQEIFAFVETTEPVNPDEEDRNE